MGYLSPAAQVVARAIAAALVPLPPPDITAWCEANIVFDERSPMPGPFRIDRFAFLREIHAALSPENPAREVTVRGSAQWGKTVSIIQPTLGSWFAYGAMDALVVHPTQSAATEWVDNKWLPMRRQARDLRRIFGEGRGDNKDAKFNQETLARNGSLKVASSGSPSDLTGTSRRLVIMDDLSKYEMNEKGDPEAMAVSRASGFEDAKILRVSTPLIKGTCRISRVFQRSDQRFFHVPCPGCGTFAPLTWENFRKSIDPERLQAAHFTCEACGTVIGHADKEAIVRAGRWVAHNPRGDHPGFHLWRAYAPQRDWASIAVEYAQVMGWTGLPVTQTTEDALHAQVAAETEQTFWNDVLGLPFEMASKGPDWEALRDRVENADEVVGPPLQKGMLPATGFILAAGVDCQGDRTEVQIVAFGRNYRRWVIDYVVIPHHIGDDEARSALNQILKSAWRTETGRRVALDVLAIDGGAYTEDVWDWALRHPWSRVIVTKGARREHAPALKRMEFDKRTDRMARRKKRQGFITGVSQMKGDFYTWLAKEDPGERGFCRFAAGLGDKYYRQLASEVRVLKRGPSGVMTSRWMVTEADGRNEALDTMLMAEAGARYKEWTYLADSGWDRLEAERGSAPDEPQGDLFTAAVPVLLPEAASVAPPVGGAARPAPVAQVSETSGWVPDRGEDWI